MGNVKIFAEITKVVRNINVICIDLSYGCGNKITNGKRKGFCYVVKRKEGHICEKRWYSEMKILRKGYMKEKRLGRAGLVDSKTTLKS